MSTRSVTPFVEDTRLNVGPSRSLPPLYILRCTKNTVFEQPVVVSLLSRIKIGIFGVSYPCANTKLKSIVTYRISEVRLPKNKVYGTTLISAKNSINSTWKNYPQKVMTWKI